MIFKDNLLEIYQDYTHFIIDIWGVIHDGTEIYPGVIKNLQKIRETGKKICFLSNAPRRSIKAEILLNNFGITKDLYDFVLTSGEATYLYLQENQNLDRKYFFNLIINWLIWLTKIHNFPTHFLIFSSQKTGT